MSGVRAVARPLLPGDIAEWPDLGRLVALWERWRATPSGDPFDPVGGPFAAFADDMLVLEKVEPGDFLYRHYGRRVAQAAGFSMAGRRSSEVEGPVGRFFVESNGRVLAEDRPFYSVNQAAHAARVHAWERGMLPVAHGARRGLIVLIRPLSHFHEVAAHVATHTGFVAATLEPIHDETGAVVDYMLIDVADTAAVLRMPDLAYLSQVYGRPLSAEEPAAIAAAAPGETVVSTMLERSRERFGRAYLIEITKVEPRPVFHLADVTELTEAREQIEARSADLARHNTLLSGAMQMAQIGYWRHLANDGGALWLSPELIEMWRLPDRRDGRYAIRTIAERFVDLGAGAVLTTARKVRQGGETATIESRFRRGDGTRITVQVRCHPERNECGDIVAVCGIVRDITAEAEAMQALEHSRAALAERTMLLSRAMGIARMGHWRRTSRDDEDLWISEELARLFGFGAEAALIPIAEVRQGHIGEGREQQCRAFEETWDTGEPRTVLSRYRTRDGREIDILAQMEAERDADGAVVAVTAVVRDVTEEQRALREIEESRAALARREQELVEAQRLGRIGHWHFDIAARRIVLAPETLHAMRFDPSTFECDYHRVLALMQADAARLIDHHRAVIRTGETGTIDIRMRRGDGSLADLSVVSRVDRDANGTVVALHGTIQDITERKTAERRLETLAYYDPLTGLANRALFNRELEATVARARDAERFAALMLLDLDHFKEVNDALGHAAGDELLAHVARRLSDIVGGGNFVARLGGDEFAVILRGPNGFEAVDRIASRIVSALCGAVELSRGEVMVGTSLGVCLLPQDASNADDALRFADLALYIAKGSGRARHLFFAPSMSETVKARMNLARDLRRTIKEGRLESHYQAQIDIQSATIDGFETLVRWRHPQRGYVPPVEFVAIAESSSLIADLGAWVLRDACRTARGWIDAGLPFGTVAVNVSVAQFLHADIAGDVEAALAETGLPPQRLLIELTESVFADQTLPRIERVLHRIKELGVGLALDDFGTGYSSLGYLNRLPFDKLKIDRCFLSGIDRDPDRRRLFDGILGLARGLGMGVVAEGVETEGELAVVREVGCPVVQG